ncbi:hypothetical protein D869_gp022 [Caulobacter phage CcrRogue]|uniref:Uncharacterized protein n=1 Tax=Caulobacter phage CcrRogue TaxID=2927986 RepID=K4JMU0_9CAUD|nr:hypothetical protein D869_gp022 [Caulobacter phage CcrRogue]AFU86504.1 hypothetical protein CcrRogue_gp022 [Caulobacter phage CcrRogue]
MDRLDRFVLAAFVITLGCFAVQAWILI